MKKSPTVLAIVAVLLIGDIAFANAPKAAAWAAVVLVVLLVFVNMIFPLLRNISRTPIKDTREE